MKLNHLILLFAFLPFISRGQSVFNGPPPLATPSIQEKNTLFQSLSDDNESKESILNLNRTTDYPTQIIRMKGRLEGQNLTCEAVTNTLAAFFMKHITKDKYVYKTLLFCQYNPETFDAVEFGIESFFDPISDLAIEHLKNFLSQYNDSDLFGSPLHIESASGVIVTLNVAAGIKQKPNTPPFIEYRKDRSHAFFKNNYDITNLLLPEIFQHFFSNEPEKILPFLNKWFFPLAGSIYKNILIDSNYVELQPELIFVMEQGDPIFVSKLKQYFNHHCDHYENHRCLKPNSMGDF